MSMRRIPITKKPEEVIKDILDHPKLILKTKEVCDILGVNLNSLRRILKNYKTKDLFERVNSRKFVMSKPQTTRIAEVYYIENGDIESYMKLKCLEVELRPLADAFWGNSNGTMERVSKRAKKVEEVTRDLHV